MQDTAIQLQTSRSTKSSSTAKSSASKKSAADAGMNDPFLQLVMSLTNQPDATAANGSETAASDISGLLGLMQGVGANTGLLSGESGSDATSALMSLLGGSANTLAALQSLRGGEAGTDSFTQLLQLLTGQASQSSADSGLGGALAGTTGLTDGLLEQLSKLPQTGRNALDAAQLTALLNSQKPGAQTQLSADTTGAVSLADLTALKAVAATAADNDGGTGDMLSQQQSAYSLLKAKELLSQSAGKTADSDDADSAEKLQSVLTSAKSASPFEVRLQSASKTQAAPVSQQIVDGLKENVSLGKTEFTIKLKPEALGEITVKLTEEAGKATLTITTASAATAKLLNSDLDALKAAMAPLNVRVNETVTQTAASQQSGSQQFDMAGQQFAGQQQQQQQLAQQLAQQYAARHSAVPFSLNYGQAQDDVYAAAASGAAMAARVASGSALDAYV